MKQYLEGKEKRIFFGIMLIYYVLSALFNYVRKSEWVFDNIATIVVLIILYYATKTLFIGKTEFVILNIGMVSHNLGNLGLYGWSYGRFAYDNITHFFVPLAAAYVLFNFVVHRFKLVDFKNHQHKAVFIIFILSTIMLIGVVHELIEYAGYVYLPPGDGLFFTGVGDGAGGATIYDDTMTDFITDFLGALAGAFLYYRIKCKK